jgi:hypothetical protein
MSEQRNVLRHPSGGKVWTGSTRSGRVTRHTITVVSGQAKRGQR